MDIPMPPVLQPRSMADYMKEYADAQGSVQQNQMNAMKLQRAPQEFAMKDRADQLELDSGETKQQNQKLMLGSGMAKAVLTRASTEAKAQGIPEGTPEYDQIINEYGHYYAPQLSKVFGKDYDPATPIDVNAVRTLAAYDGNGGEARNHLQAITGKDGKQYQFDTMNGGPAQPIMYGGEQIINPTHNPHAQGEIKKATESEHIIEVTGPNNEKFHIPAGVAAGYSRQPQAVNIDPRMAPQDMAGAENVGATPEDLQNMQGNKFGYQISPSGQKLGLSPITGPTMQEQEQVKADVKTSQERDSLILKQEIEKNAPAKLKAVSDANAQIEQLRKEYKNLQELNAITDPSKNGLDNLSAGISSSGIGQAIGGKFGTKAQSARNSIEAIRSTIVPIIMKASGLTGGAMNSEAELKQFLRSLTDPGMDIDSVNKQLDNLQSTYGGAPVKQDGLTEDEKRELGQLKAQLRR